MNVQTGAWCRFTGLNARCWGIHKRKLYFGSPAGKVNEANKGSSDASANISGVVRQAFDYLGSPYDKDLKMIRPHIQAPASGVSFDVGVTVDFDQVLPAFSPEAIVSEGASWDEATWDVDSWADDSLQLNDWQGVAEEGAAVSPYLVSYSNGGSLSWFSTDLLYDQVSGVIRA